MEDFRELLGEIAYCPIARAIRSGDSPVFAPCHKIVSLQTGPSFHLPEPWSGQIDKAPLLFISSNPSIDEHEEYPDQFWESHRTTDFFHNRFTSSAGWVNDGLCALRRDGSRGGWVRFWASARGRASEILRKKRNEVVPGVDFALTEVVHCKSRNEEGVEEARDFCSERYLKRVLSASAAEVFIVFGKPAKDAIHRCLGSAMNLSLISVGDYQRMLVFLPGPNARGPKKTLEANIGEDGLSRIRAHLKQRATFESS
jgi:hypothetical protein